MTKVPKPLALPASGGFVTYTNKVTNPGKVALSNVDLTDDKCPGVKFISGDTNRDSKLDPTETWTYKCRTNLAQTTTNTIIARGEANGLTVRDFAIAHVVVANPKPDKGAYRAALRTYLADLNVARNAFSTAMEEAIAEKSNNKKIAARQAYDAARKAAQEAFEDARAAIRTR